MFQNMWNTGAVLRRGTKGNGKYLILIIILDQNQSGSCFLMAYQISGRMDIGQILLFQNFVCRNVLFFHFFLQISQAFPQKSGKMPEIIFVFYHIQVSLKYV